MLDVVRITAEGWQQQPAVWGDDRGDGEHEAKEGGGYGTNGVGVQMNGMRDEG